jgi:RNA polymerase sigma factor (sigma-70 family)
MLLLVIAARKFNVPEADCENLVQDAMLALLARLGERVENPRGFLIGAICNACRAYWRERTRGNHVEGTRLEAVATVTVASEADRIEHELVMRRVLSRLSPADREVLRLHYYEQLTAREVAERLHVTHRYAEKRIVEALRHARIVYTELATRAAVRPVIRAPQESRAAASPGEAAREADGDVRVSCAEPPGESARL